MSAHPRDAALMPRWAGRRVIRLGLILCAFGWHGPMVPSEWYDEGGPLTECARCGAVDA